MVVDLQLAVADARDVPGHVDIESWVFRTLCAISREPIAVTVRVVEEAEIASLNQQFRKK